MQPAIRYRFLSAIPIGPWALACAVSFILISHCARRSAAQEFSLELGEAVEWITAGRSEEVRIPSDAPELLRYPMESRPIDPLLDRLPGASEPETGASTGSAAWWKVPIYLGLGLPRDLVDGVFGVLGRVPVVNLVAVGLAYEIVPTQIFIRDPRDWHRWGGAVNANGHGWLPRSYSYHNARYDSPPGSGDAETAKGPLLPEDGWGFFPTAHSMQFRYFGGASSELESFEDEEAREDLQALNRQIDWQNRQIAQRQRAARSEAIAAIDRADGFEAVARMAPYHVAYPTDESAHALLLNALAVHGDAGPPWARPYLWQEIREAGWRVLRQTRTLLEKSHRDHGANVTVAEALVFVQTRLGEFAAALEVARAASQIAQDNPIRARLYFEAALQAGDEPSAAAALELLERLSPGDESNALLALRLQLLRGSDQQTLDAFSERLALDPGNAYFHYYMGCAKLGLAENSAAAETLIESAFDDLETASLSAPTPALRERSARALSFARVLAAKESPSDRRQPTRGFLSFTPPR